MKKLLIVLIIPFVFFLTTIDWWKKETPKSFNDYFSLWKLTRYDVLKVSEVLSVDSKNKVEDLQKESFVAFKDKTFSKGLPAEIEIKDG